MKKILLIFSIAALFVTVKYANSYAKDLGFQIHTTKEDGNGYLIKKENLSNSILKITGESTSADFNITGDANGKPYVEVFAKSGNNKKLSQQEIQKILDDKYILEVRESNGELKLTAKRKSSFTLSWNNRDNINITFNIHVPTNVATTIMTTSGDVQLYDLKGNQTFTGTSGDIVAERIVGDIKIVTTSGDARLSNTLGSAFSFDAASGDLNIEKGLYNSIKSSTASGDVSLDEVSGNIDVSSASGDMRIKSNEGSLTTKSASGDQNIEIRSPKNFIRSSASSGDVRITVPASIGADVNIGGSSVSMSSRDKFSGNFSKDKSAEGKWNGGGLPINIKTGSGDINLNWN